MTRAALLLAVLALSFSAPALAQGYPGLIPEPPSSDRVRTAPVDPVPKNGIYGDAEATDIYGFVQGSDAGANPRTQAQEVQRQKREAMRERNAASRAERMQRLQQKAEERALQGQ